MAQHRILINAEGEQNFVLRNALQRHSTLFSLSEFSKHKVEKFSVLTEGCALLQDGNCVVDVTTRTPSNLQLLTEVLEAFNIKISCHLSHGVTISQRDIVLTDKDLIFIGSGEITTEDTVRVLLGCYAPGDNVNYFGVTKVVHIRNLFDRSPVHLHLDSVMKFIGSNTILLNRAVVGRDNVKRRLVKEFVFFEGSFHLSKVDVELSEYLKSEGFRVLEIDEDKLIKINNSLLIDALWLGDSVLTSTQEMYQTLKAYEHPLNIFFVKEMNWKNFFDECLVFPPKVMEKITPDMAKSTKTLQTLWQSSKDQRSSQSTNKIFLIAPVGFCSSSTIMDNYFMKTQTKSVQQIEQSALEEFSRFHCLLVSNGIEVVLFSNERHYNAPDAVFPNNWFSTHQAETTPNDRFPSTVVVYPMKAESRRAERREHIISELQKVYSQFVSLTHYEQAPLGGLFLEGTGSLVLDRIHRKAYCALSQRTHFHTAKIWCEKMKYRLFTFHAVDDQKRVVYHTNVVMSICSKVSIICLDAILDSTERNLIKDTLSHDRDVVIITLDQMNHYCGNVLEVKNEDGDLLLVMSTEAYNHFTEQQKVILQKYFKKILHTPIPTIEEVGGGSIRCMMAELY